MSQAIAKREVDVAIIGAGSAGLSARRAVMKTGSSVLLIDAGPLGTTCARVGCMPSKLLIAAADAAHHAREASLFGVEVPEVHIDGVAVMKRVQSERDRFVGFVDEVNDEAREFDQLLMGRASIREAGVLEVNSAEGRQSEVHYKSLILAIGGTPFVPPAFRDLGDALLTNEEVFELERPPESLLVVGLGVIGLELGQAFDRLGSRTTFLGVRGSLGPIADPEILDNAREILSKELDLHPEHEIKGVEKTDAGVRVCFVDSTGAERDETFEKVLIATGRRSALDRVGLDRVGIAPDDKGRWPIDRDTLQLADQPIFVAGDANGLHPLLHEASDDGRLAGANAVRYPDIRVGSRRTPLVIAFTDPQIAIVGGGYRVLDECEAGAGEVNFGNQGRSRVQGINAGKLRVYADRHNGRLMGAEIFGPRAEHLAHLLAWAVQQRMTVEQALSMPFYHPVIEEGLRTALRRLAVNIKRGDPIKCAVSELGPGAMA